ncbi:hydrocephalus-inducing protein homolog [Vidua chalybeata]|uniref:hydrocephalus-inducing protein homolog n=1 Tax=Vidua chalybeata TaxID=81927 RepID=UPI0023A7CA3A|nr:hydrocephalus-inducing protein homolog [Vidua chalybeata]
MSSVKIKPQTLTFTISGKGHEPQLTVVRPSARSKRGNAVLRFKRLQLGDSETLPLVIRNDGIIPVKVYCPSQTPHLPLSPERVVAGARRPLGARNESPPRGSPPRLTGYVKKRSEYEAQNCPGNSENLTILNNSPADVEVQFSFENAGGAETFLLDPASMALKPKEKQELTIWAYPTSPGFLEDKLICSIGKNPNPVVFSLCCHGVHMKLEVSPLELSFDKLLLHRTDSRTLVLRNYTLLPMAWQLSGLDDLVEDFSLSQDNGTIAPRSEFEVTVHFKARQIGSMKKTLRLEVSDPENIVGVVQAENIKISAEVYDVSLSIDMPKGPDGSLEFGTIHVLDNVKKVLTLKNKGLYNIEYSFTLKGAGPRMQNVASHFTVEPQSGLLTASQRGVNVELLFHPKSEILLKNKPILYCQVIDASSGGGGQAVANIPVRVSAKAEYSKYSIEPASPIDFGAMIKGTKETQTVVLENKGMLGFKFRIRRAPKEASALESKSSVKIKPQTLTFTISGKGHEPQLTVVRPSARSKRGNAVLRFKRLQLGDSETLPLVIRNDGIIPVKFMLLLEDEHAAFFLKGRASALRIFHAGDAEEGSVGNESKPPKKPFFLLPCGQSAEFGVIFKPSLAQHLEGKIRVLVGDTWSVKTLIELVGEGHKDEFTLIGLEEDTQERNAKINLKEDVIDAVRVNHINFGDCALGKPCHRTFSISNHSQTKVMHFEWEAGAPFQFSPKVGHLHPGCAKDITVSLKSDVPATFRRHLVKCKVTKVNFELPQRKVPDWDDQMRVVPRKDTTRKELAAKWPKTEKAVETVPEAAHAVVEESSQEAEVYLSAVVAYAQFELNTDMVLFKDTLPFQTRTATFTMHNTGEVALKYFWEKAAESEPAKKPYSTTLMRRFLSYDTVKHRRKLLCLFRWEQDHPSETHPKVEQLQQLAKQQKDSEQLEEQDSQQLEEQDSQQQQEQLEQQQEQDSEQDQDSELDSEQEQDSEQDSEQQDHVSPSLEVFPDVVHEVFSINPYHGIIAPGQKQTFHVRFCPQCTGMFKTTMLCRIPNLKPDQKMAWVMVKGRAWEQKSLGEPLEQTE